MVSAMLTRVRTINDLTLDEILAKDAWNLIAFLQIGSIPCYHFKPEFDALSIARKEIFCSRVDVDENPSVTERLKVIAIPTTLLFRRGNELGRWEGTYSHESLSERLDEVIKKFGPKI